MRADGTKKARREFQGMVVGTGLFCQHNSQSIQIVLYLNYYYHRFPSMMKPGLAKRKRDDCQNPEAGSVVDGLKDNDILLGRGIGPNEHPGNKRYRMIIRSFQPEYIATKRRKEKEKIALKTIERVKANGARFLRPLSDGTEREDGRSKAGKSSPKKSSKRWIVAENERVLEKTKQSLRFVGHGPQKKWGRDRDETEAADDEESDDEGRATSKRAVIVDAKDSDAYAYAYALRLKRDDTARSSGIKDALLGTKKSNTTTLSPKKQPAISRRLSTHQEISPATYTAPVPSLFSSILGGGVGTFNIGGRQQQQLPDGMLRHHEATLLGSSAGTAQQMNNETASVPPPSSAGGLLNSLLAAAVRNDFSSSSPFGVGGDGAGLRLLLQEHARQGSTGTLCSASLANRENLALASLSPMDRLRLGIPSSGGGGFTGTLAPNASPGVGTTNNMAEQDGLLRLISGGGKSIAGGSMPASALQSLLLRQHFGIGGSQAAAGARNAPVRGMGPSTSLQVLPNSTSAAGLLAGGGGSASLGLSQTGQTSPGLSNQNAALLALLLQHTGWQQQPTDASAEVLRNLVVDLLARSNHPNLDNEGGGNISEEWRRY